MPLEPREPDTLIVHPANGPRATGEPVSPPIVQSATFFGGAPGDGGELLYSRYGTNPNQVQLGRKLAALEGAEDGLALASGMAAISLTLLSLTREGDHLIASSHLYGATRLLLEKELPRRGLEVTFVDPDNPRSWRSAFRRNTRACFLEVPANPTLRIFDPRPVGRLAEEKGVLLVVDATFATPINFRALEAGADVVVHSASKYLGGHSDLIGGVVCGPEPLIDEIRGLLRLYGPALDPHAAWLLDRGLRTLSVRMERHERNAVALARWFQERPEVARVVHPSLPDHPDHQLARELFRGPGGMLGIVLAGGAPAADAFVRGLRLAAVAPSLGGVETLVSLPRLTSHRSMSRAEREGLGIEEGFVRISVGIEGLQDLEEDFGRALAQVRQAEQVG